MSRVQQQNLSKVGQIHPLPQKDNRKTKQNLLMSKYTLFLAEDQLAPWGWE